jgi:hypothetical protein
MQKMIGMVEIVLPGFNAIVSLKDGNLCDHDGLLSKSTIKLPNASPLTKSS